MYTISFLQFELKNFTESLTNLDILINNSETEEMSVSVSKSDNSVQEVLIRAQLNYLKGLIYLEQSKNEDAKKYFNIALTISPDFQNAIDRLKSIYSCLFKVSIFTFQNPFFVFPNKVIIMRRHDYTSSRLIYIWE